MKLEVDPIMTMLAASDSVSCGRNAVHRAMTPLRLTSIDLAERVDVVLGAAVGDRADARHEHVEIAEVGGECLLPLRDRRRRVDGTRVRRDRCRDSRAAAGARAGDVDVGTGALEAPSGAQPDAAAAAGDEHGPAGEVDHGRSDQSSTRTGGVFSLICAVTTSSGIEMIASYISCGMPRCHGRSGSNAGCGTGVSVAS